MYTFLWIKILIQIHVPKDVYMLNNGIPMEKSSYKEGMHSETVTFSKGQKVATDIILHGGLFICI